MENCIVNGCENTRLLHEKLCHTHYHNPAAKASSTPLPGQLKTGTYFGESGFSSTLPPALPEQGGFNERLDVILSELAMKAYKEMYLSDDTISGARTAIRTLVLEEIIGDGKKDSPHNMNAHRNREILRLEQRARLGDTHGTK